jgi:TonB family protein
MKKIIILITVLFLGFQINLKAQEKESILDILNKSNEKTTYLKDFSFDLGPGENAKYSLVLSKDNKYEFLMYLNNLQFDFELYLDKTETNLLTEKEKLSEQIIKNDFVTKQTGAYHLVVKNNSSKKAKFVLLLSYYREAENSNKNDEKTKIENKDKTSNFETEDTYVSVETMPKFLGNNNFGESSESFRKFIEKNTIYPEEAKTKKIKGRVYVSFVIDKEGYIKSAKVIRGVHPALDQEALRVVLSSPRWEPGKEKGKPVNVSFTFPIIFDLK